MLQQKIEINGFPEDDPDDEITGDIGLVLAHPDMPRDVPLSEAEIPSAQIYEFPVKRPSDAVVLDFMEHPGRDVTLSALTLGGLGFAVGAAIFSRRLR